MTLLKPPEIPIPTSHHQRREKKWLLKFYFWLGIRIEEEQTTQWTKGQTTIYKTYTWSRVTRTPLKTGGELRCSRRVNSSCSTSGTHRVNLVTNSVCFIKSSLVAKDLCFIKQTKTKYFYWFSNNNHSILITTINNKYLLC